jgi:small GTP-binding protein
MGAVEAKPNYKVVVVGNGCTGKTSFCNLLRSYKNSKLAFDSKYDATYGAEIHNIQIKGDDWKTTIHLFDTAGQEKLSIVRDSFVLGADAVYIFYAIDDKSSYEYARTKWLPYIRGICGDIPIIVCANKSDLLKTVSRSHLVTTREASIRSWDYGVAGDKIFLHNISVKTNEGIYESLQKLLSILLTTKDGKPIKYKVVGEEHTKIAKKAAQKMTTPSGFRFFESQKAPTAPSFTFGRKKKVTFDDDF